MSCNSETRKLNKTLDKHQKGKHKILLEQIHQKNPKNLLDCNKVNYKKNKRKKDWEKSLINENILLV